MKIIAQEIENSVQSQKFKVIESFAAACLENSLVFQLDNEQTPGIDISSSSITSSIVLGS